MLKNHQVEFLKENNVFIDDTEYRFLHRSINKYCFEGVKSGKKTLFHQVKIEPVICKGESLRR